MTRRFEQLSPRHRDCLRLAFRRLTSKEIARELGIAPGTVASYCTEAIAILGADDRRHAAQLLHDHETHQREGPLSEGIEPSPAPIPLPAATGRQAHLLGPLAPANRDADNDASITSRLAWIFLLAIGLAIGFGAVVSAVHTLGVIVSTER